VIVGGIVTEIALFRDLSLVLDLATGVADEVDSCWLSARSREMSGGWSRDRLIRCMRWPLSSVRIS
jgi:hypothetical protein